MPSPGATDAEAVLPSRLSPPRARTGRREAAALLLGGWLLAVPGCTDRLDPVGSAPLPSSSLMCDLDSEFLFSGAPIDGIPSIDGPNLVSAADEIPAYLDSQTRIIGMLLEGVAYAIPHNVLWFHEIVNLDVDGRSLAVTYCPLTGSSLVFDRGSVGGATFGVSGLLYKNNLVLFDRNDPSSRWPQMQGEARCGPRRGAHLPQWPAVEMRWETWVELHPETLVLAADQGYAVSYAQSNYPYGIYEEVPWYFAPDAMPELDPRRPAKERVLGVPPGEGFIPGDPSPIDPGVAFPFGALTELDGAYQAVEFTYSAESAFLLWSDEAEGGAVVRPRTEEGRRVTLMATGSGIEDVETGSTWTVDGRAVSGPLAGSRLVPIEGAYVAFWGAWAAFHVETRLWEGEE